MNYLIEEAYDTDILNGALAQIGCERQGPFFIVDDAPGPLICYESGDDPTEHSRALCEIVAREAGWPDAVMDVVPTEYEGVRRIRFSRRTGTPQLQPEPLPPHSSFGAYYARGLATLPVGQPLTIQMFERALPEPDPLRGGREDEDGAENFWEWLKAVLCATIDEYAAFGAAPLTNGMLQSAIEIWDGWEETAEGDAADTLGAAIRWRDGQPFDGGIPDDFPEEVQIVVEAPAAPPNALPEPNGPGSERVDIMSWSSNDSQDMLPRMKSVFGAFASRIDGNVEILVPHGATATIPPNAPHLPFKILVWSSPTLERRAQAVTPPERLLGYRIPVRDHALFVDIDNELEDHGYITSLSDDGFVYAYLFEQALYLTFDAVHSNRPDTYKLMEAILNIAGDTLGEGVEGRTAARRRRIERRLQQARARYAEWLIGRSSQRARQFQASIEGLSGTIDALSGELGEAMRQRTLDQEALTALSRSDPASARDELAAQFDRLIADRKILDVRLDVDEEVLKVFTDDLFVLDEDHDEWHHLGKFRIDLTASGNLRYANMTRQVHAGHHAPHVDSSGIACDGSFGEIVPPLAAANQYADIIFMAIAFLESVNMRDTYGATVVEWPVVSEEVALGERPIEYLSMRGAAGETVA